MLPLPRAADVILWGAVVAAEAVALLGALLLARRCSLRRWFLHPDTFIPACDGAHVVVMLCAYALADEVLLAAGHRWIFAGAPRPFAGLVRVAYHLETAIVLGWPAVLAAASWRVFAWKVDGRPAFLAIGACWAVVAAGLVVRFPVGRAWTARTLHGFELVAVAFALVPVARAWRRPWGTAHASVLLLVAVEMSVALIGPFVRNPFADWRLASLAYLIGFVSLAALQAHAVAVIESEK